MSSFEKSLDSYHVLTSLVILSISHVASVQGIFVRMKLSILERNKHNGKQDGKRYILELVHLKMSVSLRCQVRPCLWGGVGWGMVEMDQA